MFEIISSENPLLVYLHVNFSIEECCVTWKRTIALEMF
jgi:hypothetical protein